jgi:glutamate synthase (NADPH/NADH) small chain
VVIDPKKITNKERMKIPRHGMPEQSPLERARNFLEVPLGYTPELAVEEAMRCIQCKEPTCVAGCPVAVPIKEFLALVAEGNFGAAAKKVKETNALPAVCGRVCPQEEQCERVCTIGKKVEPVAIGRLERFVADWERLNAEVAVPVLPPPTGKKVAIIGAGPAGLTCAGDLAKLGHSVTIFEALHKPGGVLFYGIPEFRLPKDIVEAEVDYLRTLGVEIKCNFVVGMTRTIDELMNEDGYDAIFIGTGAGLPYFMNIPGENYNGVYSANEFLTRMNLMKGYQFPNVSDTPVPMAKRVAVFGGGNTAMDAARTALRLPWTEKVYLIYRRSEVEMPARIEEIHHGKEEGVEFLLLTNPTRFIGNNGWLTAVELQKMELGEPDASGRRRPVPIQGSEYTLEIDAAIIAIGNGSNPLISKTTPGLQTNKWGNIVAEESTGKTSRPKIFAGGDIVIGAATVIKAMGAGKAAAAAIHRYVTGAPEIVQTPEVTVVQK